jgi:putative hydrolase of the HAD superfamily
VKPLVVFDGDDTLWFVEPLYDTARALVAEFVEKKGLDVDHWESLQKSIDVQNVAAMGVSRNRFPSSCLEAYEQAAAEFGIVVRGQDRDEVLRRAVSVFESTALLAASTHDVLRQLRAFCDLALLTKGDPEIQERRIGHAGLTKSFDRIYIVEDKHEASFWRVLRDFDRDPADAWSVGNSLASDINPALWLGMSAIWIDAHVWEHERRESSPLYEHVHIAGSLADVVRIIRSAQSTKNLQLT